MFAVDETVAVSAGGATLALHPPAAGGLTISYFLDYGLQSPIGRQVHTETITPASFANELCMCRTFILESEADELRRQGLGSRTTLADLLVFGPRGPIDNRQRFANEPARHKVLDLVGDLALLGADLCGHVTAYRSGHSLNVDLARAPIRPHPFRLRVYGTTGGVRDGLFRVRGSHMKRLRLGVVGVGHLGKEHARILSGLADVELVGVADPNAAQAEAVALRCGTRAFASHAALAPLLDAVIVAAPTFTHHAIAADFLTRGVAVLVEKPLTVDPAQAEELVAAAAQSGAVLQVGHIERFNPAFEEVQRLPLQPKYVACERYSGFTGRSTDVGAVLDLMIHDLDLLLALVRSPVRGVEALGAAVLGGCEDVARAA